MSKISRLPSLSRESHKNSAWNRTSFPEAHDAWRREQQLFYGPQLEAYGRVLAAAGTVPLNAGSVLLAVRYALYYPELLELIDWPAAF